MTEKEFFIQALNGVFIFTREHHHDLMKHLVEAGFLRPALEGEVEGHANYICVKSFKYIPINSSAGVMILPEASPFFYDSEYYNKTDRRYG